MYCKVESFSMLSIVFSHISRRSLSCCGANIYITSHKQQGWALPEPKAIIRYAPEQIKYLTEKYNEGEASGHKWSASAVASVSNLKIYQT